MRLAVASTLLRFRNPIVFQIIDRHAYRAVYGENFPNVNQIDQQVRLYFNYLDELIQFCNQHNLNFQTIDRLLYVFDKEENGPLNQPD